MSLRSGLSWLLGVWRFSGYVLRIFYNQGYMTASSALGYSTLLALVPIVALSFAMLLHFQFFLALKQHVLSLIMGSLLPSIGESALSYINDFLSNIDQLTIFGLVSLSATSIYLFITIEETLNSVWLVRHPRPFLQRVLTFWGLITLGPLILALALSASDWVVSFGYHVPNMILQDEGVTYLLLRALLVLSLASIYIFIPNCSVLWRHALCGGAIAYGLLIVAKLIFLHYLQTTQAYHVLYGALAAVPLAILWSLVMWGVIILGAIIAAALPDFQTIRKHGSVGLSRAVLLGKALEVLRILWQAQQDGAGVPADMLARKSNLSTRSLQLLLGHLQDTKVVSQSINGAWFLSHDLSHLSIYELHQLLYEEEDATRYPGTSKEVLVLLNDLKRVKEKALSQSVLSFLEHTQR